MGPPVPGNIPWWMLRLWAKDRDLTKGQFMLLDVCIQKMDEVYRTHFREQQQAESERSRSIVRH